MRIWNRLCDIPALRVLTLVILALVTCSTATAADTAARVYKIGFLGQTSATDLSLQTSALRQGLRDLGYEEGRNLAIEYRWAERKLDRLPSLAADLVALKVDIIVTHGSPGSRAAKQATGTIPIVIAVIGDPVANGLVASLSRPGGNITGLVLQEFETTVKWFELMKQVVPKASRLGLLDVPGIEQTETAIAVAAKEDDAARSLGLDIHRVTVREPNDLHQAFAVLAQRAVGALVVPNTSLLNPLGAQIAELAAKHQLPTIGSSLFARAGGLLAYGPDGADMYRRAAGYVDMVLKGTRPADLPMEGPPKFELIINLKTAQTLGLTIPPSILARADQKID
jgi:putative tryptophan/tyrosine transport system substrate-binding protein